MIRNYKYNGKEYATLISLRRANNLSFSGSASPDFLALLGIETLQIEYPEKPVQLEEIRSQKINELNILCDEKLEQKLSPYPQHERATFDQQVREANAIVLQKDDEDYSLVKELANARGITTEDLASRILVNHMEYIEYAGKIIGKAQRLKDSLIHAETAEQIQAVDITL